MQNFSIFNAQARLVSGAIILIQSSLLARELHVAGCQAGDDGGLHAAHASSGLRYECTHL